MKYNILVISFLILIISSNSAIGDNNYIINDNTVYIDDSKVYLSATPHTLSSSGWVYFNLTSKVYTGNIDACWGFNTSASKPTKANVYSPYWVNTTTNHEKTFYNSSFITYTGDNLDYGNSYNTNYKYTVTETINNDNGTIYIINNVAFDSFDTDGINYTIYWYNRHDNRYLWKDFSSSFNSVIYDYNGYNKWYYIKNIPITSNKEYTVKAWIDVPVSTQKQSGKYYFAIKPSHETISQAVSNGHFYNLDPWWDATWSNRKNITLIGNTSGAQTDYQLLLNVTYDNDMQSDFDDLRFCNETHKLDSWLESKVDSSYAHVWVKFPTTPANGINQTYYMYYGNAGAVSDWDGAATFLVFEDGENALSGWSASIERSTTEKYEGNYSVKATGNYNHPYKSLTENDVMISTKAKQTSSGGGERLGVTLRKTSESDNQGFVLMNFHNSMLHITNLVTGSSTSVACTDPNQNNWYNWRFAIEGSNLKGKFWKVGDSEPSWMVSRSDAGIASGKIGIYGYSESGGNTAYYDEITVSKYVANQPTYVFGSEEEQLKIPPPPINLVYLSGNFWINHTWGPGTGNVTDSYNVSINDVWHNTSPSYYNDTYTAHTWQNITVWAYNLSSTGTLSLESVNQDTQIPNNPIAITNTSDWTGDAGEIVYVDYDATDIDSDTATFSCNRTDLFTDFNTVTGKGNWTATANIYYVNFGVSDGYGSTSNYTMTLRELSVTPPFLLDELKLIMFEITSGLKSINMGNYLVYAFILIGILLIILLIQILNNCIYRG